MSRLVARLVPDPIQVGSVLDDRPARIEVVGEDVLTRSVAARSPDEAPAIAGEHVTELTERPDVLDLPGIVVEAGPGAAGDADPMVVEVAAQEHQGSVADVVGQPEAQRLDQQSNRLAGVLAAQHRMGELARLDAGTGVDGPRLLHSGEHLDHVAGRAGEANGAREPVLLRGVAEQRDARGAEPGRERVQGGTVVGLERHVVERRAVRGDVLQRVVAVGVGQVGGAALASRLAQPHHRGRPVH